MARGEPAWHRRERRQRANDRLVLRLAKAAARTDSHHGSKAAMVGAADIAMVEHIVRGVVASLAVLGGGGGGKGVGKGKGKGKGPRPFMDGDWYCEAAGPRGQCGFDNFASRGT